MPDANAMMSAELAADAAENAAEAADNAAIFFDDIDDETCAEWMRATDAWRKAADHWRRAARLAIKWAKREVEKPDDGDEDE